MFHDGHYSVKTHEKLTKLLRVWCCTSYVMQSVRNAQLLVPRKTTHHDNASTHKAWSLCPIQTSRMFMFSPTHPTPLACNFRSPQWCCKYCLLVTLCFHGYSCLFRAHDFPPPYSSRRHLTQQSTKKTLRGNVKVLSVMLNSPAVIRNGALIIVNFSGCLCHTNLWDREAAH